MQWDLSSFVETAAARRRRAQLPDDALEHVPACASLTCRVPDDGGSCKQTIAGGGELRAFRTALPLEVQISSFKKIPKYLRDIISSSQPTSKQGQSFSFWRAKVTPWYEHFERKRVAAYRTASGSEVGPLSPLLPTTCRTRAASSTCTSIAVAVLKRTSGCAQTNNSLYASATEEGQHLALHFESPSSLSCTWPAFALWSPQGSQQQVKESV